MGLREELVEKTKQRLDEANDEIKRLEAAARQQGEEARRRYQDVIAELQERRDEANAHLQKLRESGDAALEDLRTGLENAWNSLKNALSNARDKF